MKRFLLLMLVSIFCFPFKTLAQKDDKEEVLKLAHVFFEALEKQDTLTFRRIMMKNSNSYVVVEGKDSARLIGKPHHNFNLKPDKIVKERMRESEVIINIHKRIATVWAPYDLSVNDKFSHCGVDVFIMLKGNKGWKIGTISYSVEPEGCK